MTRQFFRVQRVSTAGTVWMLDFTSEKHAQGYAKRLQKAQGKYSNKPVFTVEELKMQSIANEKETMSA